MSTYRMDDGTIVKTENASGCWNEKRRFDGRNMVSVNTGQEFRGQTLYRSCKGRYYLVHSSDWQGESSRAEWISHREAARWLLANERELPEDLAALAEEITE